MRTPPPSPAYTGVDAPEGIETDDFDPPVYWKEINISFEMEGVEIRLFTNEPKLVSNIVIFWYSLHPPSVEGII